MATIQSVKEKIQGLIDKSNEATGVIATDLTTAVVGLIEGYYTNKIHAVTFMDEFGTAMLHQRNVIDGEECIDPVEVGFIDAPTKEPSGNDTFAHCGWSSALGGEVEPDILNSIKEDKTVYAVFMKEGLETDSWGKISQRSLDGTAQNYYNVGDTKTITLTDGTEMTVAIAGFNIHRDTDGNKTGITFIQTSGYFQDPATKYDWWNSSSVGMNSIYNKFTDDVKNAVKQSMITTKKFDVSEKILFDDTKNLYTFAPELYNFNDDLVTSITMGSYGSKTIYKNDYDASAFPIFKGKTNNEISSIMGFGTDNLYMTRSLIYHTSQYVNISSTPELKGDITVTYTSQSRLANRYGIICFRV